MKKYLTLIVVCTFCLALSGCASMFGNKNRTLNVSSAPVGAKVYLNGREVGKTPTEVAVGNPTTNSYLVRVEKKGYAPITKAVETSFQGAGFLNILFWPGFIIDAVTGDMRRITNPNMNFNLTK